MTKSAKASEKKWVKVPIGSCNLAYRNWTLAELADEIEECARYEIEAGNCTLDDVRFRIELESHYYDDFIKTEVFYDRMETEKEFQVRMIEEERIAKEDEERDRRLLAKLKKKLGEK